MDGDLRVGPLAADCIFLGQKPPISCFRCNRELNRFVRYVLLWQMSLVFRLGAEDFDDERQAPMTMQLSATLKSGQW